MLELSLRRRQGAFTLDVDLTAGPGVTALFGASGSGKTSVVNMVAGLARPDSGHIRVDGRALFDSRAGIDLPPERRRLGYVFQEHRLFPHLSVRGNLDFGRDRLPKAERTMDFDAVVEVLGIGHLLDRRPAKLSGGEKQRVAIGRALLAGPRILLMDEPLASLDALRKAEVLPFIAGLSRRFAIPILYVSHAMDEVLRLADTLVLMEAGRAVACGPVEEILSRPDLRPITGRGDAGAVVRAVVAGHDDEHAVSTLSCAGGRLVVGRVDLPEGSAVRLRIQARDVALSLDPPGRVSVRNVLPGRVISVSIAGDFMVDVQVDCGGTLLWSRITSLSQAGLNLLRGMEVFAMVKAVTVTGGDVMDHP